MQRPVRWIAAATSAAAAMLLLLSVTTNAEATVQRRVTYLGHTFTVPNGWQVVDLSVERRACVRFDRHALYLGTPQPDENCPAGAVGRTEAVLVEPAGGAAAAGSADDPVTQQITARAPGVRVTATYDRDRRTAEKVVRQAGFGAPRAVAPRAAAPRAAASPAAVTPIARSATDFTGKGFDACTAPSSAAMNAWLSSPYRAVGVYIGGAYRACAQPNLTAAWVAQQAAAGWHFLPLYVGPQALYGQITSPAIQGAAAADDAANQAAALGFGPGAPLYYDMEGYPAAQSANALAFESAWTTELHLLGYVSGYYSSSNSGIADLVANRTAYAMPDVLDFANWNNVADTSDVNVPDNLWTDQHRVHQYAGDTTEAYAGVTINIDRDYLDVAIRPAVWDGPAVVGPICTSGGPATSCPSLPAHPTLLSRR